MTWILDRDTGQLTHSDGYREMTMAEFGRQDWPPCPVCATPLKVEPVDASSRDSVERVYIPGNVRCVRGCDLASQQ